MPEYIDASTSDKTVQNAYQRNGAINNLNRNGKGDVKRPYNPKEWACGWERVFGKRKRETR